MRLRPQQIEGQIVPIEEDKNDQFCKYALFNELNYTDKDYLKQYPTAYHLRSELIHSTEPHDVRLVFLALHHILKNRGHFLYADSDSDNGKTVQQAFEDFKVVVSDYGMSFEPENQELFLEILESSDTITNKKSELKKSYGKIDKNVEDVADLSSLIDLLAGAKVTLAKLFKDETLKDVEEKSVSLLNDMDEKIDVLTEELDEKIDLILSAKELFDAARLVKVLGDHLYISDAKVELYKKNERDLRILKEYVKKYCPDSYDLIFKDKKTEGNFVSYISKSESKNCNQESFCKFLKTFIDINKGKQDISDTEKNTLEYTEDEYRISEEIANNTFLTKLKGIENGLVPYQVNLKELKKILKNASSYLPFLNEKDKKGLSVKDKIISTFTFRIPYYVGPLNPKSEHAWIQRTDDKIYPWNFEEVVDKEACAKKFMEDLVGRCTYTGDAVLPLNSLLYSEFMVLNEINNITINGVRITTEVKQRIYADLFKNNSKQVTIKSLKKYLLSNGYMEKEDLIAGVDTTLHSKLKSYHDFKAILEKTDNDTEQVERIIQTILIYSSDKKMLRKWLENNTHGLDENDIKYILRLKYKDWGRLSRSFLTEINHVDKNGEVFSIMDKLRNESMNLMELLSNQYEFAKNAETYKNDRYGISTSIHEQLDEMYVSPSVKRSIWQTLRVVDEIVDINKAAPKKIFIEMARGGDDSLKNKRSESRKQKLINLYKACKKDAGELYEQLESESEEKLRSKKLYLYYTQFGRCMYSGEKIDLNMLLCNDKTYDIDHIFPRSKIKDDSFDNLVLVKSELNRSKTDIYPISDSIRNKMLPFWSMLFNRQLISGKKYERLKRCTELTEDELSSFIARQLVETQQSTKALATVLQSLYPNTMIVYSKAGNVTDFRKDFAIPKFRDINDFHHAKDAYLNIVVGNVYDTKFTKAFFKRIRDEKYSLNRVFDYDVKNAWVAPTKEELREYRRSKNKEEYRNQLSGTFATVYKNVFRNTPIITHALVQQKGALYDLNIMKKGSGQLPTKVGKDINKYGGYNKLTGTFYCIVKHVEKREEVITLAPVYLKDVDYYESNPEKYCKEILGYTNSQIMVKKVLINSVFEIDGTRLAFSSRTGNQNVYFQLYQLAIDNEKADYLKKLKKYYERCSVKKNMLPVTSVEGISEEKNLEMYNYFIEKGENKPYVSFATNLVEYLQICKEKFISLNIYEQATILFEILKTFQCNKTWTSLKLLNGKGTVARITKSNKLSNFDSVYLINQSVTGLYEQKIKIIGD